MKTALLIPALVLLTLTANAQKKKDSKEALNIPTLKLEKLRDLTLAKPLSEGRGAYVTAASGIVKSGDTFYVVADDELHLFSFTLQDTHLTPHALLEGELPADAKKRKDEKPDFESLVLMGATDWPPHGGLLAWPSASSVNRMKAAVLPFEKDGKLASTAVSVNILPLAYRLQPETKELNMEGVLLRDGKVFLFQRGNSKKGKNGLAEMSLASWQKGMKSADWEGKLKFESVKLGTLSGVDLTMTDAVWSKYGLLALASAEDTESAFADGTVYGSVLVRLVGNKAEILAKFDPVAKLEGLAVEENGDGVDLYLVEDADNPEIPSRLYKTHVSAAVLHAVKK